MPKTTKVKLPGLQLPEDWDFDWIETPDNLLSIDQELLREAIDINNEALTDYARAVAHDVLKRYFEEGIFFAVGRDGIHLQGDNERLLIAWTDIGIACAVGDSLPEILASITAWFNNARKDYGENEQGIAEE